MRQHSEEGFFKEIEEEKKWKKDIESKFFFAINEIYELNKRLEKIQKEREIEKKN